MYLGRYLGKTRGKIIHTPGPLGQIQVPGIGRDLGDLLDYIPT